MFSSRFFTRLEAVDRAEALRRDLDIVASIIKEQSRVLDIGCGDGALLVHLIQNKKVQGRGLEISQRGVNECVSKGLSVIQGDADADLMDYPDDCFDYVVLSQTIQATRDPYAVLQQMLRIGRYVVVSFPNFGHWTVRWQLGWTGRMPVTEVLEQAWYKTPNIHLCTIRDFLALCDLLEARVVKSLALDASGRFSSIRSLRFANLFGEVGVFLLERTA